MLNKIEYRVKMKSRRTGRIGWVRGDGTPTNHESEAGWFTQERAKFWADDIRAFYLRAIGWCAYQFEILPDRQTGGAS